MRATLDNSMSSGELKSEGDSLARHGRASAAVESLLAVRVEGTHRKDLSKPVMKCALMRWKEKSSAVHRRFLLARSYALAAPAPATDYRLCGGITGQGRKNEPLNAALPSCELNAAAP